MFSVIYGNGYATVEPAETSCRVYGCNPPNCGCGVSLEEAIECVRQYYKYEAERKVREIRNVYEETSDDKPDIEEGRAAQENQESGEEERETRVEGENEGLIDYYEGEWCTCGEWSANECFCPEADWTPREVYKLRARVKEQQHKIDVLRGLVDTLVNHVDTIKKLSKV